MFKLNSGVACSIIEGSHIHTFVFTNLKNNRIDCNRNWLCRTQLYEYTPPPPNAVNIAVYLNCWWVDFVCDRYPDLSIKDLETDRHAVDGMQVVQIYSESQKVPHQWKKFMASDENKEELVKSLFTSWKNVMLVY